MSQLPLIECLRRSEIQQRDRIAIIDGDVRLTFGEFARRVYQLANGLRSSGIGQGDAVAALCMNHHRYLEIYFACHAMGAIVVPLNIRLAGDEIVYILNDSKSRALFVDEPFLSLLESIEKGVDHELKVYFSDSTPTPPGLESMSVLQEDQASSYESPSIDEDDTAGYFYTGGTTGAPKGVELTHRNITANAFHFQAMLHFTPEDRFLHIAPMFHLADAAAIYAVTMMGGTQVFGRAFEPRLTLDLIQTHKVSVTILVPTMVNFVLNHPDFDGYDLSSLRVFMYGASPMPVALLEKAIEKFPCLPIQGYGMTEGAPLVTMLTQADHALGLGDEKWAWLLGTAGRAVPGVEIRVTDEEGREVEIGQPGEIRVRGPNMMKGYLNKPEATAEVMIDGWYRSGDVAIRNELGYVTIVDRSKDMIISGGENIYTTEVENVLMQFPGILETTVIGVPDEKWGEVVKAFVVLKKGASATSAEIIAFCRDHLANFKCPKSIEFIDELPKSGAGKILKRDLRAAYWGEGRQVS